MSLNHICNVTPTSSGQPFNPRFNSLTLDSGLTNPAQPSITAINTSSQTITSGTTTQLCTYSSNTSTGSGLSYSAGTFTATSSGTYLIQAYNTMAAAATGLRYLAISINGTEINAVSQDASATNDATLQTSATRVLAANSTIQVKMYQTSGGNLACNNPGSVTIYKLS